MKNSIKGCVNLKKYKSQGKAVEVTVNSKEEKRGKTLKTFVWISSKNVASDRSKLGDFFRAIYRYLRNRNKR